MPDNILEDAIQFARQTLDELQFEPDGVQVSTTITANPFESDLANREGPYGQEVGALVACVSGQVVRMPRRPREK